VSDSARSTPDRLASLLHPRVVAGDFAPGLDRLASELSGPNLKALRQTHGRFAVLVENASSLIWDSSATLGALGIVAIPLGRLEPKVERLLLAGVPAEIEAGLSPLLDVLRRVVRDYRCREFHWLKGRESVRRTLVMGILNVTPDSFSDGGRFATCATALEHALRMAGEGADIIDVGGCSTRPGAAEPAVEEEIERTAPLIEKLRARCNVPISIDTYRAAVARRALDAGADIINDVTALRQDGELAALAASREVSLVLMHMQGTPQTMQKDPHYDDAVGEIYRFLSDAVGRAESAGIRRERLAVDPGFGFGKTVENNLEILNRLHEFRSLGCPVLVGTSRKFTLGQVLDRPVNERLFGTAATAALAVASGASVVRVHDVQAMKDVIRMTEAVLGR
jgi:dihydropteroate synthase